MVVSVMFQTCQKGSEMAGRCHSSLQRRARAITLPIWDGTFTMSASFGTPVEKPLKQYELLFGNGIAEKWGCLCSLGELVLLYSWVSQKKMYCGKGKAIVSLKNNSPLKNYGIYMHSKISVNIKEILLYFPQHNENTNTSQQYIMIFKAI